MYTSVQFVSNTQGVNRVFSETGVFYGTRLEIPRSFVQIGKCSLCLEPLKNNGVPGTTGGVFLEVEMAGSMETATIEQIHRYKQLHIKHLDRLPTIRKLSRDQSGIAKTCAFKEFRFEPPFVARRREKGGGGGGGGGGRKKHLPPIPENMLPRRHNSLDEELSDSLLTGAPTATLPSLSISPAFITEKPEERSVSVEAPPGKSPTQPFYSAAREFTFPESSAYNKRKTLLPCQPSVVPAMTPRVRDMPLQAKIEKLAKQKRKERAKRTSDRRYERKLHQLLDPPAADTHMAFRSRREPEVPNSFNLREQKQLPFKQMSRSSPDGHGSGEKSKLPPRLYTRIVDSIYTYTKGGIHGRGGGNSRHGSYERLMVTPVTTRDDLKDEVHSRQKSVLPPII